MSTVKQAARAVAGAPVKVTVGFWKGLRYPFRGMAFVYIQHMGLVRYWIWPIVLTVLSLVGAVIGMWYAADDLAEWIWSEPSEGWQWLHSIFEVCVIYPVLLALSFLLVWLLTSVFAAPFNDSLSEEVERIAAGREAVPFSVKALIRDLFRTIILETLKIVVYLAVMVPLFLLSLFVPVVAPVVTIVGYFFTAAYFAVDYIDWPASRQNRGVRYRFGLLGKHFLPMLGFGCGVWLLLFIPIVNLVFMPAAVAGGTLLYLDLERGGLEAPPAPTAA